MQFTQDALFPIDAVQTEGYAQPEPEAAETEPEQFEDAA